MLSPNTRLQDRYRIIRPLGQGGMGHVYEALDEVLASTEESEDPFVAIKERRTEADSEKLRRAFEQEANLLRRLRHPALPLVSDHFVDGGGQFLVMQYIRGVTLAELLQLRDGPARCAEVLNWADRLLEALEYLHTQDPPIIHRDIKPANIKLTEHGEIYLLDFGLAKGGGHLTTSVHWWTRAYAPLEQFNQSGTDAKSDLYALGATMYHLLTRRLPVIISDRHEQMIEQGKADPLPPAHELNEAVPRVVSEVIQQAMTLYKKDRIESASRMREALRQAREAIEEEVRQRREEEAKLKREAEELARQQAAKEAQRRAEIEAQQRVEAGLLERRSVAASEVEEVKGKQEEKRLKDRDSFVETITNFAGEEDVISITRPPMEEVSVVQYVAWFTAMYVGAITLVSAAATLLEVPPNPSLSGLNTYILMAVAYFTGQIFARQNKRYFSNGEFRRLLVGVFTVELVVQLCALFLVYLQMEDVSIPLIQLALIPLVVIELFHFTVLFAILGPLSGRVIRQTYPVETPFSASPSATFPLDPNGAQAALTESGTGPHSAGLEAITSGVFSLADIKRLIGVRYHYYLTKWREMMADDRLTFNWAAFFFGGQWVAYRKMYFYLSFYWLGESLAIFGPFILLRSKTFGWQMLSFFLIGLGLRTLLGSYANSIYRAHVRRKLRYIKAKQVSADEESAWLKRMSGTSILGAIIYLFVSWLGLALVVVLVRGIVEFFLYLTA